MLQEPPTPSLILSGHVLAAPGLNRPAVPQQSCNIQQQNESQSMQGNGYQGLLPEELGHSSIVIVDSER